MKNTFKYIATFVALISGLAVYAQNISSGVYFEENGIAYAKRAVINDDGTYKILYGYDNNVSLVQGMIQSFYDAPGHGYNTDGQLVDYGTFYEELCEINIGAGVEYWYNNIFAVRGGYFNETALKGNRKYVTLGAALKYNVFGLDISYLIPVNTVAGSNPLENTLRFNLTYSMGGKKD